MSVWLVVNPRAGGGRGQRVLAELLPLLSAQQVRPTVHVCADGSEPEAVTRAAVADGAELVVAVGGDGHAGAVAEGLIGSPVTLAVVPAGSANDYAYVSSDACRAPAFWPRSRAFSAAPMSTIRQSRCSAAARCRSAPTGRWA